jgi:hypothetical protein
MKRLRTCRKTDYRMKRLRTCRKTDCRMKRLRTCRKTDYRMKRLRTCHKTDCRMKRLRTCRKTDCRMNEWMNECWRQQEKGAIKHTRRKITFKVLTTLKTKHKSYPSATISLQYVLLRFSDIRVSSRNVRYKTAVECRLCFVSLTHSVSYPQAANTISALCIRLINVTWVSQLEKQDLSHCCSAQPASSLHYGAWSRAQQCRHERDRNTALFHTPLLHR